MGFRCPGRNCGRRGRLCPVRIAECAWRAVGERLVLWIGGILRLLAFLGFIRGQKRNFLLCLAIRIAVLLLSCDFCSSIGGNLLSNF